jgi:carbamoyl-phosphate synthase large subunit
VIEVALLEKPKGVIVQFGGQTPLNLVKRLEAAGIPIIGTSPDAIDRAEDRERFQQLIQKLDLKQPPNRTVRSVEESFIAAEEIGYPLVVRPSYVLGGRAMEIVYNQEELKRYMHDAVKVSNESPVLLDFFLNAAIEIDIDLVSDGKQAVVGGIMQHIEQAGIHSGDSACSLPPYNLPQEVQERIRTQVKALALELGVVGLMNTQLAYQEGELYVIEVNPRASRTVPFVSKCIGHSLAKIAARCMAGTSLAEQGFEAEVVPENFAVKEAIFPFNKFPGVDPILGPEMKSTGEVMGVGKTFAEAYAKAQMGAGEKFATAGNAFISVREADKDKVVEVAKQTLALGYNIVATHGTAKVIADAGLPVTRVNKVAEGRPHIVDMLKNDEIQLVFNTTEGKQAIADSSMIRRTALRHRVFCTTTIAGALAVCEALAFGSELSVYTLQDLHEQLKSA